MVSQRIKFIANIIEDRSDLADIGSDHGYLLFELVNNGFSHKLLGVENKIGPFKSLKKEVSSIIKNKKCTIDCILSDGIKDLTPNYKSVVIAGMGLPLIKKIINANLEKLEFINDFYIDSHTNFEETRDFFIELGYDIKFEKMLFDSSIFYDIIHFCKSENINKYNEVELKYGPININNKDKVFISYLKEKLVEKNNILNKLPQNNEKRDKIIKEINEIEGILYGN